MGKEYPAESGGYAAFSRKLKHSFRNTPGSTAQEVDKALEKGQYVVKGMFKPVAWRPFFSNTQNWKHFTFYAGTATSSAATTVNKQNNVLEMNDDDSTSVTCTRRSGAKL